MAGRAEDDSDAAANEQATVERNEEVIEDGSLEEQKADDDDPASEDCEGAEARVLPDPGEPTASQVEDRGANGHLPYRSWCAECYEGRATGGSTGSEQETAPCASSPSTTCS